jgi:hypothetical protein
MMNNWNVWNWSQIDVRNTHLRKTLQLESLFVFKLVRDGLQTVGNRRLVCVISSFRREVDENCAVLGYYIATTGNFLPKFQDNLSISNYHCMLHNNSEKCSNQEAYILTRRCVQNIKWYIFSVNSFGDNGKDIYNLRVSTIRMFARVMISLTR